MFSKYELLPLDQANSGSDPSQILILQFSIPRASLPSSPSLSNFTLVNLNLSLKQSISCSSLVSLFFPTPFDHTLPHVLDLPHHFPSQANQIFNKLYEDHNTLKIKHAAHQKAESLRAASLSKLNNRVSNNSILNTKYVQFSTKS